MRTHSISVIHSILPSDEHQEDPVVQEAQEDQEDRVIPMGTQMNQEQYPLLISSPSNPQETSNLLEYPPYSSMATELTQMPSSENFEFT